MSEGVQAFYTPMVNPEPEGPAPGAHRTLESDSKGNLLGHLGEWNQLSRDTDWCAEVK